MIHGWQCTGKIKSNGHADWAVLALPGEGLIGELFHPEKLLLHGWLGGRDSSKIPGDPDPRASFLHTDVALTLAHPPRLPRRVRAAAVEERGAGREGPSCRGKGERPS